MVNVSAVASSASARVAVRRMAYARTGRWNSVKSASKRARGAVGVGSVTVRGRPLAPRGSSSLLCRLPAELEQADRFIEALERQPATLAEVEALADGEVAHRAGHQDRAGPRPITQTGRELHRGAEQVVVIGH